MQIPSREFDAIVDSAIRRIPPPFLGRLRNIAFLVESEPPEPGLLGLYQGRPLTERSVSEPASLPDTITIYQGPHERMAHDEDHLRKIVEDTVWHEVAHYFGLNEEEVLRAERRRDVERRRRSRRIR